LIRSRRWFGSCVLSALLILGGCASPVTTDIASSDVAITPTQVERAPSGSDSEAVAVASTMPVRSTATVRVGFSAETLPPGDVVTATVSVGDVEDLYGVQVRLAFDEEQLEVVDQDEETVGIQVAHGGFLEVGYQLLNEVDAAAGTLDYAVSQMPPSSGVSGDGHLLSVAFRTKAPGVARVAVTEVVLAAFGGDAIPVALDPGVAELSVE
jgi:hypothetical protein